MINFAKLLSASNQNRTLKTPLGTDGEVGFPFVCGGRALSMPSSIREMRAKESFALLTALSSSLPAVIMLYKMVTSILLADSLSIVSSDCMLSSWQGTEGVLRPIARKDPKSNNPQGAELCQHTFQRGLFPTWTFTWEPSPGQCLDCSLWESRKRGPN